MMRCDAEGSGRAVASASVKHPPAGSPGMLRMSTTLGSSSVFLAGTDLVCVCVRARVRAWYAVARTAGRQR